MINFFYDDCIISNYEKRGEWEETISYLKSLVHSDNTDKSIFFRYAAQCWYVLTFWDCFMPKEKLSRSFFEMNMKSAYRIAKKYYWNDSNCLWLFGYFMCINQTDFLFIDKNILEIEQMGNNLIIKAYSFDINNPLSEIMYLADNGTKQDYKNAVEKAKSSITEKFPGDSAVDCYFREIFTHCI